MATDTSIFKKANKAIIFDIQKELRLQGHYLTGALEASIEEREVHENGGITLTAKAAEYLRTLEEGIQPEDIVINSDKLAEMTKYVELRMGYRGGKAMQVAYRILQKQALEGNPTNSSYKYSKTGKRTEAVSETFNKNENRYGAMVDTAVVGSLDTIFHQPQNGTI